MKYKEAQIHGAVDLRKHVERLVAHERHRKEEKRLKATEIQCWKGISVGSRRFPHTI